jgi:hypothetical protein
MRMSTEAPAAPDAAAEADDAAADDGDLVGTGQLDRVDRAEVAQQILDPLGAEPGDVAEAGGACVGGGLRGGLHRDLRGGRDT